jgi:hypothetical protein
MARSPQAIRSGTKWFADFKGLGAITSAALLAIVLAGISRNMLTTLDYPQSSVDPVPLYTDLSGLPPITARIRNPLIANIVFIVNSRGVPCLIQVDECADQAFARSLYDKVALWRFTPAMRGGRPILQTVTVPLAASR